jgi:hypothetical protein
MKMMKKTLLVILLLVGTFEGCKKYEDGPFISLRSAKHRLYGEYTLTTLNVDGEDQLNQYYDSLGKRFHFFFEDVNYYYDCDMSGFRKDGGLSTLVWTWSFTNKNKFLRITSSGGNYPGWSYGPFRNNYLPEWEILQLTNKEVKMKTTYNSKEYLIDLKE